MDTFAMLRFATLAFAGCLLVAVPASAQTTYTVTKVADTDDGVCDADCSLREAIAAANADEAEDQVAFAASLAGESISFAPGHGALVITEDLVIDGTGLDITVDARQQDRVFRMEAPTVRLIELTITNGRTGGSGGGILSQTGRVVLTRSTVVRNEANGVGGGVCARELVATRSTISNNMALIDGGGISCGGDGLFISTTTVSENRSGGIGGVSINGTVGFLSGSTITRNSGSVGRTNELGVGGIGVLNVSGEGRSAGGDGFRISGNIIAGNTVRGNPRSPRADCGSLMMVSGVVEGNISGEGTGCVNLDGGGASTDPAEVFTTVLDPLLADNGGPTFTHLLLAPDDDPALNPAVDVFPDCSTADQRGWNPFDGDNDGEVACDAGSVELVATDLAPPVTVTITPVAPPIAIPAVGGSFLFNATFTNPTDQTQTVEAWTLATLPDNSLRVESPLLGPVRVTLAPGETLMRQLEQRVPRVAPAGDYAYLGYVGYAGAFTSRAILDRDSFGGSKAAGRNEGASGDEAWTVIDVATGEPVEAGDEWRSGGLAGASSVPSAFALSAAYPNPFRSATEISLAVPTASEVRVAVYDVLGRRVAVLLSGEVEAGTHTVRFDGADVPSGVYLVRAEAGSSVATQRVTLVR